MWFLALRHLLSRKRQSILIFLGITLGTTAFVAISGMMIGFQEYIVNQLVNNDAHIRISRREQRITSESVKSALFDDHELVRWQTPPSGRRDSPNIEHVGGWMDRLDANPIVASYAPQLVLNGILNRGDVSINVRAIGTDPERQSRITTIENYMLQGKFKDIGQTGNRVVVGEGVLQALGAKTSETIHLSTGRGEPTAFKIVGVFQFGIKGLDDAVIFTSITDLQKANKTPSEVSDLAVRLTDVSLARKVATTWASTSNDKVQSWDQANENVLSVFTVQDVVRFSMTISILVVAGFGVYNVLNMMVNQKQREIAILRSIGFPPRDILILFLTQGVILGLFGGILGDVIGYFVSLWMSHLEVGSAKNMGRTGTMLVSFQPMIYVRGFFLAFVASVVASVLPARAAAKLSPIQIIRSAEG